MVYNGTSSGLDEVLWDPHFMLPTMTTHMGSIQLSTSMGDIDIGEMFLNFMMNKIIRNVCGVDVTHIRLEDNILTYWESQIYSKW